MFQLDYLDHRPLYEQIKEKLKALIISGVLKPNERVPSVREMAQSLTINPNTIQKAYKDLELEGYIYAIRAKGSFVTPFADKVNQARRGDLMLEIDKLISELAYMNIPKEQLISRIEEIYSKKEGKKID
ncbi:Transcriptional regulator, GntR family [Dehalobacter sp. UNSWDHB]|jgi:Predicted transcriptional regulators|uniref:GntR family transcriptional regulator n=1 Tax=unclassified Dehalobacter TaxID=2635733 RepID=UPI00028A5A0E|nr:MULTISPECIES: GntR family transcriptional regulator [unclassified Dehalobacter]AFV03456.1 Transcriptional regulator, GntR family [Dehalobacter sp. DCA]AFV06443.1 Transcriptional regulator, GntR family [Dehalobacter sp. CF]EQB20015.1 Transcriptional regulator, GntR family [Dehalobacter sp. UNSWDHB]